MSTFLTASDNDLLLVEGSLVVESDPVTEAAISLYQKFQMFLGEWFLDSRIGVPYFEVVFVKNPDTDLIKRLVTRILMSEEIIVDAQVTVYYLPAERMAAFEFVATADDGREIVGGSGKPFIVSEDITE